TTNAERSPLLKEVTVRLVSAAGEHVAAAPEFRVVRYDRPAAVESSYPFEYEADTPRIRYLRDKYALASVGPRNGTDLEQTTALRYWVSRRWDKGWDAGKYQYIPPWDALTLL